MRVTIIPSEYKIQVDGRSLEFDEKDWNFDDNHIHAIQWKDDSGHIEFVTNDPNEQIEDIEIIDNYLSLFFAEIPKIEQIRIQNEEKKRLEEQNFAEEEEKHKKELEDLRRKIQETAEENARLRKKRAEDSIKRTQEIVEKENEERRLKIEKELLQVENERLKAQEEIKLREKLFEQHFKEQNEEFLKAQEKIAKESSNIEEKFNLHLKAVEENQKAIVQSIENQKKVLQIQEKEFEKNRKLKEKEIEVVSDQISLELEKLQKEKEINDQKFELELESIDKRKKELEDQYSDAEKKVHIALLENQAKLDEIEKQKQFIEEYSNAKYAEVTEILRNAQILQEQNELRNKDLDLKQLEVDNLIRQSQENFEIQTYESIKAKAVEDFIQEQEQKELANIARQRASERIKTIAEDVDPLAFLTLVGSEASFDIQNFPVEKMISWFTLLKKVKDLSVQYNLSYEEVISNEEIRNMLTSISAPIDPPGPPAPPL